MIKFFFFLLLMFCLTAFVFLKSGALQFEKRTFGQTELAERVKMVPVFYGYRLQAYLGQQLEAVQEWVRYTSQAIRKPA